MNKILRKEFLILLLCILIGLALRFYTFDQKSLWMDEVHTYNDSRDSLRGQFKFYKENPTYLHPPFFYVLTHLFYPFNKPERDLRILPLIFGTLSIPMIYFLSRLFSPGIALPCALSLTFMAYHISLSQDGRSYTLLMFMGMAGLYFFMKYLASLKKKHLFLVAFLFALLFYTSYSSIPFIALAQILWFYRVRDNEKNPPLSSFFVLNGLIFLCCIPWILFVVFHYKGQPIMDPLHTEAPGSFLNILYGVIHDWAPHPPLSIASLILLILFPLFSKSLRNAFILLGLFLLPLAGLYLFCILSNTTHFITSRYFINFLPLFFITLYLSLEAMETKLEKLRRLMRLRLLFVILFTASSLAILPFYYQAEKQDFRGLVTYLKRNLKNGDKIYVETVGFIPGILHYFGEHPEGRHHLIPFWGVPEGIEYRKSFTYQNRKFIIYNSKTCCSQYVADGSRLWIVTSKGVAKKIKGNSPSVLKGVFDGSFLNFSRFPTDASLYLFLWDPYSPEERGIDMPIE
jgi:hypothetical protein